MTQQGTVATVPGNFDPGVFEFSKSRPGLRVEIGDLRRWIFWRCNKSRFGGD